MGSNPFKERMDFSQAFLQPKGCLSHWAVALWGGPKQGGWRKHVCFCLCLTVLPLEDSSLVVTWKSWGFSYHFGFFALGSGSCQWFLVQHCELDHQSWLHSHGTLSQLSSSNPLTPWDPVTISPSFPTLPVCCLHPQNGHLPFFLVAHIRLYKWLCPPKPPTAALEHGSSQPVAMFPIYQQAPVPIPALTPLSPCCGVMASDATATSLSTALPILPCRISSHLFCFPRIVPEWSLFSSSVHHIISYCLLKLSTYFCFSLTSPLQTVSPAKNGSGVPAPFRLVCGYIRCPVSNELNQDTRMLLYLSKIFYYSKTTWLINSWKTK